MDSGLPFMSACMIGTGHDASLRNAAMDTNQGIAISAVPEPYSEELDKRARIQTLLAENKRLHDLVKSKSKLLLEYKNALKDIELKNAMLGQVLMGLREKSLKAYIENIRFVNTVTTAYYALEWDRVQPNSGFEKWSRCIQTVRCNHTPVGALMSSPKVLDPVKRNEVSPRGTIDDVEGFVRQNFLNHGDSEVGIDDSVYTAYQLNMASTNCALCETTFQSEKEQSYHLLCVHARVSTDALRRKYECQYENMLGRKLYRTPLPFGYDNAMKHLHV